MIFVSTPHRGSFRVSSPALSLIRRLVRLPVALVKDLDEISRLNIGKLKGGRDGIPTAVDNMNPNGRFVRTLSTCPDHAEGDDPLDHFRCWGRPVSGKTDGFVAYESARLDGVASEKIVRSSHSTQGEPDTILEVRRILREHVRGD